MYFPATHDGFVQNINPRVCRKIICGPGRVESQMYSKETQLTNRAKLGPLNSIFLHNRQTYCIVNKGENSTKANMALQPRLQQTH